MLKFFILNNSDHQCLHSKILNSLLHECRSQELKICKNMFKACLDCLQIISLWNLTHHRIWKMALDNKCNKNLLYSSRSINCLKTWREKLYPTLDTLFDTYELGS